MKKVFVLVTFVFLLQSVFSQGCSQCRLLAKQGSELSADSFGSNLNYGILYLMTIPYLLLMFFFRKRIFSFFKKFKKA